ncbi:hypothetical protein [Paracoccus salsus]|uniref:hypothetical protein n=1 Tax=Paracoccus salsus TaxID=2911061 RepID=UPI001F48AE44|nr:hypothetical protein [Paracoccus salsus]MCF3975075.1 hypothetical protein [Paracoccus salsus]
MAKKIIVLGPRHVEDDEGRRPWAERAKAIKSIKGRGGRIESDNGGRILVVDDVEDEAALLRSLPDGAKVLAPGDDVASVMRTMEPQERLFAKALQVRFSQAFITQKKTRTVGESPEERELFSHTCTPPGED